MKNFITLKSLDGPLLYLMVALCFMGPAFYNGFPLVFSDTGTYISSGMENFIPKDRPIFYGWWIKLTIFVWSLWWVIFFQSLVLSFVVVKTCKKVVGLNASIWIFALAVVLSAFTGLGWYNSQIMPDIWLGITFLCLLNLLYHKEHLIIFALLGSFGLMTHNSHIPIVLVGLLGVFLIEVTMLKKQSFQWVWPLSTVTFSMVLMLLVNGIGKDHWFPFRGGHAFLMGRMVDTGLAQRFLEDNCASRNYKMCKYIETFPSDSRELLWDPQSPLQLEGGWEKVKLEYNDINREILTTPKYLISFLGQAATGTLSQLLQNGVGSGLKSDWYASPSSPPYQSIEKHFPHQMPLYLQSRQNGNLWKQGLKFEWLNRIYPILLLLCLGLLIRPGYLRTGERTMMLVVIKLILANALIVATFANVYDRLQGRVSWILVLCGLAFIMVKYATRDEVLISSEQED